MICRYLSLDKFIASHVKNKSERKVSLFLIFYKSKRKKYSIDVVFSWVEASQNKINDDIKTSTSRRRNIKETFPLKYNKCLFWSTNMRHFVQSCFFEVLDLGKSFFFCNIHWEPNRDSFKIFVFYGDYRCIFNEVIMELLTFLFVFFFSLY